MATPPVLPSRAGLFSLALLLATAFSPACGAGEFTVQLVLRGQNIEGKPLSLAEDRVILLARDGRLWDFDPQEVKDYAKLPGPFRSYAQGEFRGQLQREFGARFDVSGTGHYVVVHPAGQKDLWAERFEDLYRSFVQYYTARGLRPQAPAFPLVAVVFGRREEFVRYATAEGFAMGPDMLGYYSPLSNRIALYDQTSGDKKQDWRENGATIIHEAAHQVAFNTGIHSRYAPPPRWVIEGLGTMFEAPGVWNSQQYRQQTDRINRGRLQSFVRLASQRPKGLIAELISSDRMFENNVEQAYAEAWSFSFFLAETEPRKYFAYLAKTAAREAFSEYTGPQRLRDFVDVFGGDLALLEARYLRFMAGLK